jgi:ferric-chelate reductase [NAD(P)H]
MANAIDFKVFRDFSYGLYLVTSKDGDRLNGQIVNTVIQVTSEPPRVAVIINKKNLTHEFISSSKVFAACIIDESVTIKFIGPFGFKSGRDINKFENVKYKPGITGSPMLLEYTLSALESKVFNQVDLGTHTVFIADVVNTEIFKEGNPLTYRYYHEHLRGKTPPNAPTYKSS